MLYYYSNVLATASVACNTYRMCPLKHLFAVAHCAVRSYYEEIHLWRCKWQSFTGQVPDSPREVHATEVMFPNTSILLRLICTLPVTSCECERSISVLRRLKTYLRTTMGQERLTGLALMHVHYATEIDLDEVINILHVSTHAAC